MPTLRGAVFRCIEVFCYIWLRVEAVPCAHPEATTKGRPYRKFWKFDLEAKELIWYK